jgi:hypothetical protein
LVGDISATCVLYNFVETAGRGKGRDIKKYYKILGRVAKCPPKEPVPGRSA